MEVCDSQVCILPEQGRCQATVPQFGLKGVRIDPLRSGRARRASRNPGNPRHRQEVAGVGRCIPLHGGLLQINDSGISTTYPGKEHSTASPSSLKTGSRSTKRKPVYTKSRTPPGFPKLPRGSCLFENAHYTRMYCGPTSTTNPSTNLTPTPLSSSHEQSYTKPKLFPHASNSRIVTPPQDNKSLS